MVDLRGHDCWTRVCPVMNEDGSVDRNEDIEDTDDNEELSETEELRQTLDVDAVAN